MVMYDNNMIMCLKQKERKFEPRIKLNHNMYTKTTMLICFQNFRIFSFVVERSLDDSYITIFFCCVELCFKTLSYNIAFIMGAKCFNYHRKKITNLR